MTGVCIWMMASFAIGYLLGRSNRQWWRQRRLIKITLRVNHILEVWQWPVGKDFERSLELPPQEVTKAIAEERSTAAWRWN